jgi:malate dehydrogenase (oxaloacetate-decarboxylating)
VSLPNASYAITMRLHLAVDDPQALGRATTAVGAAGGVVTAVDFVDVRDHHQVVDVTANTSGQAQADEVVAAVGEAPGVTVHRTSDRTFLLHLGGKLQIEATVPLKTRDDLSMAYTPGVARVCTAIAEHPEDAARLTIAGNTVAIVTDGSAVLGLGDIGPRAAMPVMEGKAVLFKRFADVDAWPVCLDVGRPDDLHERADRIVAAVEAIAPGYGGVNLEDIAAPVCFEVEERLRTSLDIPVFHDDQHGTAIVVLAALTNALRLVGKDPADVSVALSGAGAAGAAVARLLVAEGIGRLVVADHEGILHPDRPDIAPGEDPSKVWLASNTNADRLTGGLRDALPGADVFIGVSAGGILAPEDLDVLADDAVVFALANPEPEVDPQGAAARANVTVVATGRSDQPNQINNVLAFPGVFRGALDARAFAITEEMKVAAAHAIADVVGANELHATYIIPSVFNEAVAPAVADAVRRVAAHDTVP